MSIEPQKTISLVISDETEPKIFSKTGTKLETISVQLIDPSGELAVPVAKAALCGGTSTCVAILEVGEL